jgi:NAD(P)-dependent dehydrogenase (short-subunit alcohol dehydrogenase family)
MSIELTGQGLIVTGAASGIGEATAHVLARRGAKVVIADVADAAGAAVVESIKNEGGTAAYFHCDVRDPAQTDALVAFAVKEFGRLDGAANNAGVAHTPAALHEVPEEAWRFVFDVDVHGVVNCMRSEIRHFLTVGGGAIVNTASISGLKATVGMGGYSAAKHAVVGLTRQGALDYVKQHIRVNAIAPGVVETPVFFDQPEEYQALYRATTAMGRGATPEEIGQAIAFLISDDASYITGSILVIDGGTTQKN